VALAAFAKGKSVIEGTGRLVHKESNRALTLKEEFQKLGIEIKLQDDLMIIEGGKVIGNTQLDSHHDHRIAMALTVAASAAEGSSIINNAEATAKSYPGFFDDMKKSGLTLNLIN
jgi:3-phosphoshikimate 1-carboxyvinyltransferase